MARKVMLLARELGLGGTERQLAETALALDRAEFEPHVGCFTGDGFRARELRDAGVPVVELGVRSFASASALSGARQMGAYLNRHQIELVHAFDVPLDLFAVPVARLYRAPVTLASQRASRHLTPGTTRWLLRITDRLAQGIVVNSQAIARELTVEDGVPASKIRLVYNGIDTSRFRPDGVRAPTSGLTVGIVCALRPEKGLETLIAAFQRVRGARLVIVGSGPMLERLRALAGDSVHFEPAVKDVAPWLRAMDVFVLPSLSEALSNALMEAMACGCCPIASNVGGNPELVTEGETGLLFPPGDVDALASRLELVLRETELRRRFAANAARRMHTEFTREAAARRMGEVYREFLNSVVY